MLPPLENGGQRDQGRPIQPPTKGEVDHIRLAHVEPSNSPRQNGVNSLLPILPAPLLVPDVQELAGGTEIQFQVLRMLIPLGVLLGIQEILLRIIKR